MERWAMEFMESPEEIASQLDAARERLQQFEDDVPTAVLMGRLRAAHPFHPALLARNLFLVLAMLGVAAAIAVWLVPFVLYDLPDWLVKLERGVGLPLPVVFSVFALCLGIAFFMAGQAAMGFARDCPLMANEQREHERLLNEVKRLSSQKAIMDRVRATPMGARPRTATPASQRRAASPMSNLSWNTPNPNPSLALGLNTTARGGGERSYSPPRDAVSPSPLKRLTSPLGTTPRPANTIPKPAARNDTVNPSEDADVPQEVTDRTRRLFTGGDETPRPSNYFSSQATPRPQDAAAFEARFSTHLPKWGPVDEPWLEDAIQKSEMLAKGFPVQAHLEFSTEANLPFTLILERATPAMAVRAMVSYVEFLASIATPPRGRIVLRSVPHLDRSFHRNVESALEPYFGDRARVIREPDRIEIRFDEPDSGWKDYPTLPIATE